jgi:hypothetical protein
MRSRCALVVIALLASACYPRASVPDSERQRAARELDGQQRFARVALFVAPLFGDGSKLLVSDQPVDELDLLRDSDGARIAPPPAQRVVLPGTALRIERVEFPTGWIIASRVVLTPRYHPWVILRQDGEARPLVLVLPQDLTTAESVRVEVDRVLGSSDVGEVYLALPDAQRAAIGKKQLVDGMGARAVEMAWGYPERKVIDRPANAETWTWPAGRRKASFQEGKLVRWQTMRAPP